MARIPRMAKGRRNSFFEAEGIDDLMAMVLELTAEVSVLRERQYALERVLEDHQIPAGSEIEAWQPNAQDESELSEQRQQLLANVLRTLEVTTKGPAKPAEQSSIREVSSEPVQLRAGAND